MMQAFHAVIRALDGDYLKWVAREQKRRQQASKHESEED